MAKWLVLLTLLLPLQGCVAVDIMQGWGDTSSLKRTCNDLYTGDTAISRDKLDECLEANPRRVGWQDHP